MAFLGLGFSFMIMFVVLIGLVLVPLIFYLLTLQRALAKCSPTNRGMSPGLVWLQIIPLFGFIWQFFVVTAVSSSLEKEYASRRAHVESQPGRNLGIAMCVTALCTSIPYIGVLCGLAHLVLWIMYWVKIANVSSALDRVPAAYGRVGGGQPGGYYQAPSYNPPAYGQTGYGQPALAAAPGYAPAAYPQPVEPRPTPPIDDTSAWLSSSARSTARTCPACGAALDSSSTVCGRCGA